jgi:hypothetical protein
MVHLLSLGVRDGWTIGGEGIPQRKVEAHCTCTSVDQTQLYFGTRCGYTHYRLICLGQRQLIAYLEYYQPYKLEQNIDRNGRL